MKWMRMLGKVVIVTRMRKVPESCSRCGYYDSMGKIGGRWNEGVCTAMPAFFSTEHIIVSKERLPNCPLRMVEREERNV